MSWTAQSVSSGVLTYTAAGVSVSKNLIRQFIALDDFSGHYGGGVHGDDSGCVNPAFNGTTEAIGTVNITQSRYGDHFTELPTSGGGLLVLPGTLRSSARWET